MSQKFADEISPQGGRHNVAHGASRGSERPPLPPPPSPAQAGEGGQRGERGGREPESHGLERVKKIKLSGDDAPVRCHSERSEESRSVFLPLRTELRARFLAAMKIAECFIDSKGVSSKQLFSCTVVS